MLLNDVDCLFAGILPFIVITVLCAACAYSVNAQRSPDDPQKRKCHPVAIVLAPITLPLFVVFTLLRFVLKVLFFGACLILFPIALIVVREGFLLRWFNKIATYIGNKLLDANTTLATPFLNAGAARPEIKESAVRVDPLFSRFV